MKKLAFSISLALLPCIVYAQATLPPCPNGTQSCNQSYQNMGDSTSQANDSQSNASQANASSNSNQSGNTIDATQKLQQSGNSVAQNGNTVQGGNSSSTGNTIGPIQGSTNNAQVSGGNINSSGSGNVTGGTTSATTTGGTATTNSGSVNTQGGTVGNTTSSSGGNQLDNRMDGNTNSGGNVTAGPATTNAGNIRTQGGQGGAARSSSGGNSTTSDAGHNKLSNGSASTSGSSADNSGNSSVNVDGSDRSSYTDNSRFTVIPPVVPPTPPAILGVGNISTSRSACGPQQTIVRQPYNAYYFGFFKTKTLDGGYTDELEPATLAGAPDPFTIITYADGSKIWLGSQVIVSTAVLGVSAGRNLALGGGSGSGSWGQAGGGANSSMQKLVTTITVMQCVYGQGPVQTRTILKEVPRRHISQ